jgi:lysophospholipase L1-like esterase
MNKTEAVTRCEVRQSRVSLANAATFPMPAADAMPGSSSGPARKLGWRRRLVLGGVGAMLGLFSCETPGAAKLEALPASPDSRFQLAGILQQDDFQDGLSGWTLESERPAHVTASGGVLDIDAPAGLSLWLRPELQGPLLIEYEAAAVSSGGPNDRVSDLNSFWMATDPGSTAGPAGRRTGAFSDYNTLRMYYVGLGGNGNTTTRFRRYVASATERPLLPENDRSAPQDLLQPNQFQRIRIVANDGLIQYYRDDRKLFEYTDSQPYTRGWFAFRTTQSHLRIRHFSVYRLVSADTFHFSRQQSDGNYQVTLRLHGRRDISAHCTVQAEARRLMIEAFPLPAGEVELRFIVNVRTPVLSPRPPDAPNAPIAPAAPAVRLPAAEIGSPDWDNVLTFDVPGCASLVTNVTVEPVRVPTVYLVGDSTVTDVPQGPGASWGQMLPRFFKPDVAVANHAKSGASLKSFLTELRLDKVLSTLVPGDWLMIQFGHNDQKKQWPQTYVEADTTYRAYLRVYIAEAHRRGAIPVLITSPERRNFNGRGQIVDSLEGYPDAVRAVAREESVALIDLNAMSKAFYETLGPERAALAFRDDGRDKTHHSDYGAYELARMVVTGVRAADPALVGDLARHLSPDAATFDPRKPDLPEHFNLSDGTNTNRRQAE